MKYLKKYSSFKESILVDLNIQSVADILESLTIWTDSLLEAIGAEELDIFDTFKLPSEDYKDKLDLDYLENNVEFINSLTSIALKKSEMKLSEDYQTFLNKPCRFMFIYGIDKNELENPSYLIFQSWNETLNKWEDLKLYKIYENIQRFYDKLISRTIEIVDGGDKYIYMASNANEWVLQNTEKENDIYKRVFRKEELEDLLSKQNIKVNIL
jgi:hypothetical protein